MTLVQAMDAARPGQHLCHMYGSQQELWAAVCAFVRTGLEGGDLVVHATGSDLASARKFLAAAGLGCEQALESGQLRLIFLAEIEPDGSGSRSAGLAALVGPILAARAAGGYPALRMSSEVASLVGAESLGQMSAREALATGLTTTGPVIGMCLYDRRRFPREFLDRVTEVHDALVAPDGPVYVDHQLTISCADDGQVLRVAGQVDCSDSEALREAMTAQIGDHGADLVVDVSELSFIDVGGLRILLEAARQRADRSVVVRGPSAQVQSMLHLLAGDSPANLVVDPGSERR